MSLIEDLKKFKAKLVKLKSPKQPMELLKLIIPPKNMYRKNQESNQQKKTEIEITSSSLIILH